MGSVTFGVTTGPTGLGLAQSYSKNSQVEIAEARGATGNVAAVTDYNPTEEYSFEVVVSATLPQVGATTTFGGNVALITGVNETESNTEYKRATITARRWVRAGLPA